jgi:hypothetical protein
MPEQYHRSSCNRPVVDLIQINLYDLSSELDKIIRLLFEMDNGEKGAKLGSDQRKRSFDRVALIFFLCSIPTLWCVGLD